MPLQNDRFALLQGNEAQDRGVGICRVGEEEAFLGDPQRRKNFLQPSAGWGFLASEHGGVSTGFLHAKEQRSTWWIYSNSLAMIFHLIP